MNTQKLTREWLLEAVQGIEAIRDEIPFGLDDDSNKTLEAFKVALSAMNIEPVVPVNIAPGILRCAKCSFVLTKNTINMSAGTITAGNSKSEPCPNGCGPLWPVTWKEHALKARDDSEQWFEDLQVAKARIAELESRTVTVKLPLMMNLKIAGDKTTKAYFGGTNEGIRNTTKAFEVALTDAGIKWEAV